MRLALALAVLAAVALANVAEAQAQTSARPGFPGPGEALYEWCAQVKRPSSIAICSDPELRSLAIERQRAFNEVRSGLDPQRDKALMADQSGWVMSYPKACGLSLDTPPALPLAPAIKDCMAQAGRARIAYLRAYGTSDATSAAHSEDRIGPGFDCAVVHAPLALLICADVELSKTDLRFNQAYQALRQSLDPAGRQRLAAEDVEFLNTVKLACGVSEAGTVAGSGECIAAHYNRKRAEWISRLSGPAYEEANRPIEQHVAFQAQLQRINFLPPTAKIDGVYNSATRTAILEWQTASGRPVTGFISDADAAVFGAAEPRLVAGLAPAQRSAPSKDLGPTPLLPNASGVPAPTGEANEVTLRQRGGIYRVPVRINDQITLDFTLDSGASDVQIPADVVLTLFRTETLASSDFIGEETYMLADGSKVPSARFNLRELRVGNHRLRNVVASVGPPTGALLLGQSFLSRFRSWTLDNGRHVLVLTEH